MDDILLELLQIALGKRETLSRFPDGEAAWRELMDTVSAQSLMGVTFPAIEKLYNADIVPTDIYCSWLVMVSRVKEMSALQLKASQGLYQMFEHNKCRSCILKGSSVAALYPEPQLRQSGDVDIWVDADRKRLVPALRAHFPVQKVVYHHCEFTLKGGLHVEVHFTPSWMNGYFANRRLQRWFAEMADRQFANIDPQLGFATPTLGFYGVYSLIHIYRHVLEEGIGLRQLMDYYYLLRHMTGEERASVYRELRRLRMQGFAAAVMYVLREVFLLEDEYLLCPPDVKEGAFLLESVLCSGNFGRADKRNAHSADETLMGHGRRKLRRNARLLFHYPAEVLGMPFFMLWQYLWRRRNAYLYKGR